MEKYWPGKREKEQDTKGEIINIDTFTEKFSDKITEKVFYKYFDANFNKENLSNNILHVLVLAIDRKTIEKEFTDNPLKSIINFNDYGNSFYQWKPYKDQPTIIELLAQYKIHSGIEIKYIEYAKIKENYRDFINVINKILFIADPLSLNNSTFNKLVTTLNEQQSPPALLIPVCKQKNDKVVGLMRKTIDSKFEGYVELYKHAKNLDNEYAQIELELPDKYHFFRKLTNIARLKLKIGNSIRTDDKRLEELQKEISSSNL